jgi:sec-independent protein translocase protein TatB
VRQNQVVFDINGGEMLVLAGIALVVLGPDKLPGYAAQAARMLRQLRTLADGAKDQMRDQLGPEFDDVDWKALDPRQYDPRRIVRDALSGADQDAADSAGSEGAEKPVSRGAPTPVDPDGAASADGSDGTDGADAGPKPKPATYDEDAT